MIYPRKNKLLFRILHYYATLVTGRHFHEVLFNTIETDKNKSILLIANHYSFWDALILYRVNTRLLHKKMHVMILEESMHRYAMFKYGGMFSVKKNSRDILKSLDYAAKLLDDPANLVLIYPQGRLHSNFVEHIHFEKGVLNIIKAAQAQFQLVFAAAFVQYFKHTKPTATVYLKAETTDFAAKYLTELQSAYQQHYDTSKLLQTEIDIETHP
jgi:1-acyl-sn-glycerol-3-phosphate acyltransferase